MTSSSLLRRSSKNMDVSGTPPMAKRARSSSESSMDDDFDEAYFSKTYVPLSNLPTPPLSSHSTVSSRQQSPEVLFSPGEFLDPELLGPAVHLSNLIPSSTSLTPSSVPLLHALLTRSSLPLETIALAVCILDSLNSRFALQWRKGCPLNTPLSPTNLPSSFSDFASQRHIDSIHPEIIPLAALILAVKFVDDAQQTTKEYVMQWACGMWSCEQVNFTQRCLMDNLGYRLLPLWEESIILEALEDMERAGRQFELEILEEDVRNFCRSHKRAMSDGKAVIGFGQQLTPMETPMLENVRGTKDLDAETRKAFLSRGVGAMAKEEQYFQLVDRTAAMEPFPVFVDHGL